MTTPSNKPVPSNLAQDLLFNAEKIDQSVNSSDLTYVDRLGVQRQTLAGAVNDVRSYSVRGVWASGTVYAPKDVVQQSGTWYFCVEAHTASAAFATDAAKWRVFQGITAADLNSLTVGKGPDMVAARLADGTATTLTEALTAEQRSRNDMDALQTLAENLANGVAQTVELYGDSIFYSVDPANLAVQVATPVSAALQTFVNTFFGNTALTVVNRAVSGSTLAEALAGTDGSGSTFEAKMAATSAVVIFENDEVNPAYGSKKMTPAAYRASLIQFIRIVRKYGKVPVLSTSIPSIILGSLGSAARAEATARYAQIKREVANGFGVVLVDNRKWLEQTLGQDGSLPLSMVPDGVHGSQATYIRMGQNLADAIIGQQVIGIRRHGQRVPASVASVRASNQISSGSSSSRLGVVITSGASGAQSLRVLFRVEEVGLDISMLHCLLDSMSDSITFQLDGNTIGGPSIFSQQHPGYPGSGAFFQDFETLVVRNCAPGLHMLNLTTSSGGVSIHGLRAREAGRPLMLPSAFVVPTLRRTLISRIEIGGSTDDTLALCDDAPASRFLEACDLEWSAQMLKNSALVIGGNVGTNGGTAAAVRAISVGLNSSGFLTVWETTALGVQTATVLGATDLSTAEHRFRIVLSSSRFGTVTCVVDGAAVGSAVSLTRPFYGGLIGAWRGTASAGTLVIKDVARVWGL